MTVKLSYAELRERLGCCPRPGQLFRHYKNNHVYCVVGAAILESSQEPLVIYERWHTDEVTAPMARPLSEWRQLVVHDGLAVERFRAVEG
jgi:hypothetical protein